MNLASSKVFKGLAVGSLALAISGVATIPASFAADPAPAASQSSDARTIADKAMAKITQGLPGQFQVAYSKKTNKIWVAGTADRDEHVSTIARIDANSLKIEAVAELPIIKGDSGYSYEGAYGITVDDEEGTVWVTSTRDNSVAVYDQATMKQLWTNAGLSKDDPNWIEHPRSVLVDHESGKAFVTGRFFVSAIDLKTKQVEKIQLEGAPDGGTRYISMNILVDGGKLYVPERTGGKIFVIDTKTFKVETSFETKGNAEGEVRPSDIAIDHSQNEIYVSSQGVKGANSGVSIYDATTHEFKKFIPVGTQALALDNDEANDLVYVSDFGTGKVGVIDGGAADKLIGEVEMNGAAANDVTLLKDGSVLVLDKKDRDEKVTLPYVLNGTTGEISTASEYTTLPGKDRQGNDVPASVQQLKANSILKFKVDLKDTAESVAPVTLTPTALQFAGYPTVTGVKADESKPTDPKSEDAKKDNSSTPAPSQSADSATDAKDTAKSDAKTDNKSDSRDELNPSKDGVKADESKPTDPKSEDAKKAEDKKSEDAKSEDKKSDAKSENTAESKDQTSKDQVSQSDAKSDAKTGAQDSKSAPDAVKADKSGSSQAQRKGGSSKGALASTGANGVAGLLAVGSVALLGGAAILARRRKA